MASRKTNYFRGMNSMSSSQKDKKTSSIFGTISSVLTGGKFANIKVTAESENRDVPISLPYGYACFPFKGIEVHAIRTGKNVSIIGMKDNKRPVTKNGEVIIYTRDGTYIKLDNKGNISVHGNIAIDGNVNIDGNISIKGTVDIKGSLTVNGRSI